MDITPKLLRELIKEERLKASDVLLETPPNLAEMNLPGLPGEDDNTYAMTMEELKTQLRALTKSVDELRGGTEQYGPLFAGIQALVTMADNEDSTLNLQIGKILNFLQELRKEEIHDSDFPRPDEIDGVLEPADVDSPE